MFLPMIQLSGRRQPPVQTLKIATYQAKGPYVLKTQRLCSFIVSLSFRCGKAQEVREARGERNCCAHRCPLSSGVVGGVSGGSRTSFFIVA